jgi:pantothenate synthetase
MVTEPLISLEYVAICDPETFQELPEVRPGTLLAIAAQVGTIRLVDNILLRDDGTWQI